MRYGLRVFYPRESLEGACQTKAHKQVTRLTPRKNHLSGPVGLTVLRACTAICGFNSSKWWPQDLRHLRSECIRDERRPPGRALLAISWTRVDA
eukprot:2925472-Prymnesium_polylepis.1